MPLTASRAQLAGAHLHNHGPHGGADPAASGGLGSAPAVPGRARVHASSFSSTLRCNVQAQQAGSQLPASHPISASSSFSGSTAGSAAPSAPTSTDGRAAAGSTLLLQQQQQRTCAASGSSSSSGGRGGGSSSSSLSSQHSTRSSSGVLLAPQLATSSSSSSGRSSSSGGGSGAGGMALHTALRTPHTDASTSYLERLHRQRTNAAEAAAAAVASGSTALSRTQAALQRLQARSRSAPGLGASSSSSSTAGLPQHLSDGGCPAGGLSYLQRPALAAGRPSSLGAGGADAAEALLQSNRQQLQERLQALCCGSGAVTPGLGRRYSHEGAPAVCTAGAGSSAPALAGRRCSSAGTAAELASSRLSRLSSPGVLAGTRAAEAAAAAAPPATAAPTVRWSASSYLGVACDPLTACNPLGQQQQQQAGQHRRSSSLGAVALEAQHRRSSGNGSFHTAATSLRSTPYVSLSGSDGGSSCGLCMQCGSTCCTCSSSMAGAARDMAAMLDVEPPSSAGVACSAHGSLERQGSGPPLGTSLSSRAASRQPSFLIGTAADEDADGASSELAQHSGGGVSCPGEAAMQFLTGTFMSRSNSLSSAAVAGPDTGAKQQRQQQQQQPSRPGMSLYRGRQQAPSSDSDAESESDVSSMSTSLERGYSDSSHSGDSDSDNGGGGDCYAGRSGAAAAARRQLAGRPLGSSCSISTEGGGSGPDSATGSSCGSGKDVGLLSGASSSSGSSTDSSSLQRQVALAAARAAAGSSGSGSSSSSSAAGGLVAVACGRAKLGGGLGVPAGCVGLQNLGNTCFMNSILQCLNCLPELVEALLDSKASRRRSRSERTSGMVWHAKASVGPALCELLQQMWVGARSGSSSSSRSRMAAVSPRAFLHALSRADDRWSRGCQQDSQEFLHSLLELLQGECNRVQAKPQYRELSSAGSEAAQAAEAAAYARSWHDSAVDDLFGGFLQSTITCSNCGHCSHCFDPFLDLSVPIPKSRAVSLQDCLSAFVEKELLQGSEQVKCGSCSKCCDASKRLQIYSYPQLLVLTLKRFASSGSGRASGSWLGFSSSSYSKYTTPVMLPGPDVPLDLAPYCSAAGLAAAAAAGRAPPRYELLAVSQHSGSLGGGHYTACGRSIASGAWFDFNDAHVTPDREPSGSSSSSAYVLFFRLA